MDFHRHLTQFRLSCNLLIPATGDNESQDFSLAWRQGIEAFLQFGNDLRFLPPGTIALDPRLDGIKQLLLAQRLGQELDGAGFHGSHRHGNVAVRADKYDWKVDVRFLQCALELQTARPRQSDVKHDAARRIPTLAIKKLLRRPECLHLEAE